MTTAAKQALLDALTAERFTVHTRPGDRPPPPDTPTMCAKRRLDLAEAIGVTDNVVRIA